VESASSSRKVERLSGGQTASRPREHPVGRNGRQVLWAAVCECRFEHRGSTAMSTYVLIGIPPTRSSGGNRLGGHEGGWIGK
jgi:hypothetical protein